MPLSAADKLAISETIARYCHATDEGDGEGTAAQFAENGILEIAGAWQARGHAQIADVGRIPNKPAHWVNSIVIDGNGSTATSRVYYLAIRAGGDLLATGRYDSELTKQFNGEWKLVHHRYTGDLVSAPSQPAERDGRLTPEDKLAVLDLIARYNNAIDNREADAWAATFVEEGRFEVVGGPVMTGRDALVAYVRGLPPSDSRHWTTNTIIEGTDTEATVRCYLAMMGAGGISITGRYSDTAVRVGDSWKFRERRVTVDGFRGDK